MKKLFALLLTVVMMASMMVPAMAAYSAVTPGDDEHKSTITHTLTLTKETDTRLDYDITYTFDVEKDATILNKANDGIGADGTTAPVTGAPEIDQIVYGIDSVFDTNKTATQYLDVDWSNVKINQPGAYRWKVTQYVTEEAPEEASGNEKVFYLFVYVWDDGGVLKSSILMYEDPTIPENATKTNTIPETYPAKVVDLTISKTVTGNQGSQDQYFQFHVTLETPSFNKVTRTLNYTIDGEKYTINVPATAYHPATTNHQSITVNKEVFEFDIWLKSGETVTIHDMIYNTKYTVEEMKNSGYTVTARVEGSDTTGQWDQKNTVTDTGLTGDATLKYTNHKQTDVPTGISLEAGVAFFGIVLAMGMMMLMFVGKRKEQN